MSLFENHVYLASPFCEIGERLAAYLSYMATRVGTSKRSVQTGRKIALKALSVLAMAFLVVAPSVLHSSFGIGISPILTGSMRPYAQPGDVFVTKTTNASNLKVGDIISVRSEATGVFYAHRIVKITKQSGLLRIVTKGDANANPEINPFMVGPNQQVSRNIMRVKWLGRPLVYLTSLQGRQAALSLMVLANLIALFLFLFRKKTKAIDPHWVQVYKELYAEAQEIKEKKEKELSLFRDLFTESQMDKATKEFEMAEQLKEMKRHQLIKEL